MQGTPRKERWALVRSSPIKTGSTLKRKYSPQSNKNEVKVCSCFRWIAVTLLNNEPLKVNNICISVILFFLSKVQLPHEGCA